MLKPLGMSESPLKYTCWTELLYLTGFVMNSGLKLLEVRVSWILKEEFSSNTKTMLEHLIRGNHVKYCRLKKPNHTRSQSRMCCKVSVDRILFSITDFFKSRKIVSSCHRFCNFYSILKNIGLLQSVPGISGTIKLHRRYLWTIF